MGSRFSSCAGANKGVDHRNIGEGSKLIVSMDIPIARCSPHNQRIKRGIITRQYSLKQNCDKYAETCRYYIKGFGCCWLQVMTNRMELPPPKVAEDALSDPDANLDFFGSDAKSKNKSKKKSQSKHSA
ncbi:MAG: hypothetical protein WCF94_00025 [bacterium]